MEQHYLQSSFREKLIEHLFVGELLKISWRRGNCSLEIAKPEVDNRGYDLIVEGNGTVRHVQLKTAHLTATASGQKVNIGLESKPSACLIWIMFDEATLQLGPYLFFGGRPGEPMPSVGGFKIAKHTKANAQGVKAERPALRVIPKSKFEVIPTVDQLHDRLMGGCSTDPRSRIKALEAQFRALISQRLQEFSGVSPPALLSLSYPLPERHTPAWLPVSGMYGGFSFWADDDQDSLVVESWSRVVERSGQRHRITEHGFELIEEGFV